MRNSRITSGLNDFVRGTYNATIASSLMLAHSLGQVGKGILDTVTFNTFEMEEPSPRLRERIREYIQRIPQTSAGVQGGRVGLLSPLAVTVGAIATPLLYI